MIKNVEIDGQVCVDSSGLAIGDDLPLSRSQTDKVISMYIRQIFDRVDLTIPAQQSMARSAILNQNTEGNIK